MYALPLLMLVPVLFLALPVCGKTFIDPWLVCNGAIPLGIPMGIDHAIYNNLLQNFCQITRTRHSAGCFCLSSASTPECDGGRSQNSLLVGALVAGDITPTDYCLQRCTCQPEPIAAGQMLATLTRVRSYTATMEPTVPQSPDPFAAARAALGQQFGPVGTRWRNRIGTGTGRSQGVSTMETLTACWRECGPAGLKCGGGSGAVGLRAGDDTSGTTCTCRAVQTMVDARTRQPLYIGVCVNYPNRRKGTREEVKVGETGAEAEAEIEGLPCPCNATYVSMSCCGVVDGVVWEDPYLKLGELVRWDEL